MSQESPVTLYPTKGSAVSAGFTAIQDALNQAATNSWGSCYITCDENFSNEEAVINEGNVKASIQFDGCPDAYFGSTNDFYLSGEIELTNSAVVRKTKSVKSKESDITLKTSSSLTAETSVKAYGKIYVDAGATVTATTGSITATTGDITLADSYGDGYFGSTMTAGTSITAGGKIDVQCNSTMTAGDSITAGGNVDVKNGSTVTATTGSITATNGNITLADYVEDHSTNSTTMTAGDSITANGITVGTNATVTATTGSITATTGNITLVYDSDEGLGSTMTAGDSITAKGTITVGTNSTITATHGSITATNGDITLDEYVYSIGSAQMTADTSIAAGGKITVGYGSTVTATKGSITATTGITLECDEESYDDNMGGSAMTAGDSIDAGGGTIDLGMNSRMTAGDSITAGAINVDARGIITATTGSITATTGDITIEDYSSFYPGTEMTAGDSIIAGGKIQVGTKATVEANKITAKGAITLNNGDSTYFATMTALDSIAAGGKITVGECAEMTAGSIKAASIDNTATGAKITIDAGGFSNGTKKVIDVNSNEGLSVDSDHFELKNATGLSFVQLTDGDVFITDQDILYVNAAWASEGEGEEVSIGSKTAIIGTDAFATVAGAVDVATSANPIMVIGGDFGEISSFGGYTSLIQAGTFNYGVMGGVLVTEPDTVKTGSISMTVYGGTYKKLVAAGDCANSGSVIRCGSYNDDDPENIVTEDTTINFTIAGGVFHSGVAGGMEYMKTESPDGSSTLYGNIYLNVSGGEFKNYLYGGNIAANKTVSGSTHIIGNVTTTIDATGGNTIKLNKLVAGSYGNGEIKGDAKLILKGNASNLDFVAGGEIWGGCGGDTYKAGTPGERTFKSSVTGSRTLSFTGFSGKLDSDCAKIRAFSDIEFLDDSDVELVREDYVLSDVVNWTFEYGSSLTGSFDNNFTNDTLTLDLSSLTPGSLDTDWEWTVLENTNTTGNVFKGFGGGEHDLEVFNGTKSMGWDTDQLCYTDGTYSLTLDETETKLVLTLA